VAQQLRNAGFGEAYALTGGFDAWQAGGGLVEPQMRDEITPDQETG